MRSKNVKYIMWLMIPVLLWIFAFGGFLVNARGGGDVGDSRNMMYILEHWFQFFCGKENILTYNMFYPVNNALVYSDMLFLLAIPYTILRFLSINMYFSYKYATLFFSLLGLIGMFHLVYRKMKCSGLEAVFATIVFSMANIYLLILNNWLMAGIAMFPYIGIIIINIYQNFTQKKIRKINFILLITVLASVFYTSCYIAYFMLLAVLFSTVLFLLYDIFVSKHILCLIIKWIKVNIKEVILYVVYGVFIMLPFCFCYLFSGIDNKREWDDVLMYLQNPISYIQMPDGNLLQGELLGHNENGISGIPIFTILVLIIVVWKSITKLNKNKNDYVYLLSLDFALISLIIPLFCIKIGNFSLWYIIYRYFPGAASMRGTPRFRLIIPFLSALAVVILLKQIGSVKKLENVVLVVLIAQYLTFSGMPTTWSISEEMEWLDTIPAPPDKCKVMFLLDDSDKYGGNYTVKQLDSLAIANKYNLKCINGYCSYYPPGWLRINYMTDLAYVINVYTWLERNHAFSEDEIFYYEADSKRWINLNGFPASELIGKQTAVRDGYYEQGSIYIEPNGMTFGPYANLNSGNYTITVVGEKLDKLNFGVSHEDMGVNWSIRDSDTDKVIIAIKIPVDIDNFEFLIYNWSGEITKIDSVILDISK